MESGKIETRWAGRLAAFGEMEIDRERLRVFLYDYDRQAEALRDGAVDQDQSLRQEFEEFWLPRYTSDPYDQHAWGRLRTKFRERGIILPSEPNRRPVLLLNALYSARAGHPVGWRYRKLVEVAHCIADRHKDLLRAFRHALAVYGRAEQIRAEDKEEKWRKKAQAYKPLLANNTPEYKPDRSFDALVEILFPELGWSETQDPAASSGSP